VLHGGPGFDQASLRPRLNGLADLVQLVFVDMHGRAGPGRRGADGHARPAVLRRQAPGDRCSVRPAGRGGYDLRPRLGEITIPALVVAGEHDRVCPPSAGPRPRVRPAARDALRPARRRARRLRRAVAEQPDRFRAAVAGLLADQAA